MAEVTDGDRERAADVLAAILEDDDTQFSSLTLIAMAIAAEREKARAPFLALAEDWERKQSIVRKVSGDKDRAAHWLHAGMAADLIRRAAGATE